MSGIPLLYQYLLISSLGLFHNNKIHNMSKAFIYDLKIICDLRKLYGVYTAPFKYRSNAQFDELFFKI